MDNLSYYFSIFRRRLPYFLIVATILSAISVTVAYTLPPAYESKMVLLVEAPQIPEELASSTVQTPAFEQLQIVQQRLLTRGNMLDIARKLSVLPNMSVMSPDEIVAAMRARTTISTSNRRLLEAPLMTVSFEAPAARTAASVLNEYLILIQRQDSEFRKNRAGGTLEFFEQEVARLSQELDQHSARILEFKQANTDALPESLQFRLDQQAVYQDRMSQIDRDISDLNSQHTRLIQLYELTGSSSASQDVPKSADERQLDRLNTQLEEALAVYSPENPRVKMLETRINQLEEKIGTAPAPATDASGEDADAPKPLPPVLTIQLAEIKSRVASLERQRVSVEAQLEKLVNSIDQTAEVSVALEDLQRKHETVQSQYNRAEERLSVAKTGDRIETRSRGQRIAVIEQPAIPSAPTKPNRMMIAGGGTAAGIFAGFALVFLMNILNTSPRRPVDIVNKLGVTPLTTIPYIQTRGQRFRQRGRKLFVVLAILVGIPAMVYAVHIYYLPLDLIAEKVMNKMGVRW